MPLILSSEWRVHEVSENWCQLRDTAPPVVQASLYECTYEQISRREGQQFEEAKQAKVAELAGEVPGFGRSVWRASQSCKNLGLLTLQTLLLAFSATVTTGGVS